MIDKEIASRGYNVKWAGAKGDKVSEDTAAFAKAISASENFGEIFIPSGTYRVNIAELTKDLRKTLTFRGMGIGQTIIQVIGDDGIVLKGYVLRIRDLELMGNGSGSGIKILQMADSGDSVVGRCWIQYVQVTNFEHGITANNFDQFWIEKSNFSSNHKNGINVIANRGAALLNVEDVITNNNGQHGVYIYTSSIIGHITITNHESIANGIDGIHIEGSTNNSILSVNLNNLDIEGVSNSNSSALYMRKVWKSWINGGQFSAKQGKSSFAGIWLDSCRNIIISHPWIRKSGDGMGTPTHDVYLSDGSEQIYFISAFYYGLPITINTDVTVDKSKIVNLDTFVSSRKKHFISAKDFSLAQGTPQLQKVGNLEAWVLGRQNPHQAVLTSHIAPSRVKAIHLLWFNNSAESAGSVSWQLMHSNIAFGSSVEGPRNYTNVSSQVQSNGILIKTTLIPSLSMNGGDLFYLWVVRNSSDSNGDTLAGSVGLVGIELEYE